MRIEIHSPMTRTMTATLTLQLRELILTNLQKLVDYSDII